jgi:hypothetical protein
MANAFRAAIVRISTRRIVRRTLFTLALAALALSLDANSARGQVIVEVQEDWELVIADPDANSAGPQITCVISPYTHVTGLYAALELNQQTHPHYIPGGVQLHTWDGECILESENFPSDAVLSTQGETIQWTQRMAIVHGQIVFDTDSGVSETWGNFGANGHLWISRESPVENLNSYSPDVSVENSGIGYAANRVERLVLKQVRYYTASGLHSTDTTERVVHELTTE